MDLLTSVFSKKVWGLSVKEVNKDMIRKLTKNKNKNDLQLEARTTLWALVTEEGMCAQQAWRLS